jgi:hypothetical protein
VAVGFPRVAVGVPAVAIRVPTVVVGAVRTWCSSG